MSKFKELDSRIRKLKIALVDNLDCEFNPINIELDASIEKELSKLYKERSKIQGIKIDTLSDMYLRVYQ